MLGDKSLCNVPQLRIIGTNIGYGVTPKYEPMHMRLKREPRVISNARLTMENGVVYIGTYREVSDKSGISYDAIRIRCSQNINYMTKGWKVEKLHK